jgi:hypothetical protein
MQDKNGALFRKLMKAAKLGKPKATRKQVDLLKEFGRRVPHNLSKEKACKIIGELLEKQALCKKPSHTIQIANGLIHYSYGVIDYVDDGNGGIWDGNLQDEFDRPWEDCVEEW